MRHASRQAFAALALLAVAAWATPPARATTVNATLDRTTLETPAGPAANCPQGGTTSVDLPTGAYGPIKARITLRFNDTALGSRGGSSWGYNVAFTVAPIDATGAVTAAPISSSLSVFRGLERESFEAVAVLAPWRARGAVLCVTGVSGPDLTAVPPNMILALSLEATPAIVFNTGAQPSIVLQSDRVTLTNIPAGADAYEFEWTYADRLDAAGTARDPVRVRSGRPEFELDLAYPAGTLQVRGRALSGAGTSGIGAVGSWSAPLSVSIDPACGSQPNCVAPVDPSLNWRYLSTYSQSSAAASSFTVFDAALRSRQTQQRMRSQSERLINETQVDREGRGRLQMLPAPLDGERYGYAPTFNAAAGAGNAGVPYDYEIFDGVVPPPVSNDRGAGKYYSSNAGPNANAYTPDAEGYPFSANEPVRDTSARLRRAGAHGGALALGKGRESRFRYGTAESSTLRRLFGRNVGRAAHYERTLQIDQNGQAHVAYVDGAGNAIATALAGDTPATLEPIDRTLGSWLTYSLNENNSIDVRAGTSRSVNTVVTTATSNLFFTYRLGGVEYSTPTANGFPAVCESCRYELRVRITDLQGNAVPLCKGVTRGDSCSCAGATDELVEDMGNPSASLPFCALNGDDARSTVSTVGSPLQFCAQLPEGEFEVVKQLEVVNDALVQTLTDATTTTTFVTTHGSRPPETDAGRMCGMSCETFCAEGTRDPTRSTAAYTSCVQSCRDPTTWAFAALALQSCRSLQSRLDADLAPDGLYAGQTQHPEQCHVDACRARNDPAHNSDAFDDRMMKVERHADALCRGYLDPLQGTTGAPAIPASCAGITRERDPAFEPGGYGVPVRQWMDDALRDYATTMPGFPQSAPPGLAGKTIWALAAEPVMYTDATNPNGRTPNNDEQWRMFRSLYFGAKQTALAQHTEQSGCAFLDSPNARVKRSSAYNSVFEALNALTLAQGDFCVSLCDTRVSNWMSKLGESCPALGRNRRGIASDLRAYCQSTCGPANPLSTITQDAIRNHKSLLSAASRLPRECSLDVLIANPPFTTGTVCRPEFPTSSSSSGSIGASAGVRGNLLASGGASGLLSPAARDLLAQACHVVPTGVNPSHVIPPGATPGDRLTQCEHEADDLAAQQQILLLESATTSFLTRAREVNHERCLGARFNESFSYEAAPNEYHYTLRYYDQAGDLVQTVPPKGTQPLTSQQVAQLEDMNAANDPVSPVHELVTRYQYDSAGQVVRRRAPDSGETRYWYNRAGQLRFSQTSQQAADRRYAYLRYDARGRLVESGLVAGLPTVADIMTIFALAGTPITEAQAREFIDWIFKIYVNVPVTPLVGGSITTEEVVTRTYDRPSSACGPLAAENLRGRMSAVVAKTTLGDVTTCYSYDPHGNVATLMQRIPQLGDKRIDYEYDILDGKILATHYQPGTDEALHHRYSYDDDRRLVAVETSRDGELWERDAAYGYYRHGPLARIELGADRVQGLDYLHSINGWPKGVNADSLNAERDPGHDAHGAGANRAVARDAFGSAVHYFPGDYTPAGLTMQAQAAQPLLRAATRAGGATVLSALMAAGCVSASQPNLCGLYDGSPNATVYSVSGLAAPIRGVSYRYDQLNRLRSADSFDGADLAANAWPTVAPAPAARSPWRGSLQYDPNGNITQLERTAADPAGVVAAGVAMDELTYRYGADSNRLLHVNDGVLASRFDGDLDDQGTPFTPGGYANYSYDLSGRLTRDGGAGLNAIRWNSGNRVQSIDRTDDTIEYVYDGLGQRIAKITRAAPDPNAWHYEFFARDVKGEILATYRKAPPSVLMPTSRTVLVDQTIRGARRLGILKPALMTAGPIVIGGTGTTTPPIGIVNTGAAQPSLSRYDRVRGAKQYELVNHLENVYATITDRKKEIVDAATGDVTHYEAEVANRYDYDPFGSLLAGRGRETAAYRYGFSGLERDDELKGAGNSYYTNARLFDPRVARWLSPDAIDTPDSSPFVGFANNPLRFSDPEGTAPGDTMQDKQLALMELQKSDSKTVANNAVWTVKQDRYAGLTSESESAWRSIDFGDWWADNVEKPVIKPIKVTIRWTLGIADPVGIVEAKMDESDEILGHDTSGGETLTALRSVAGVAFGHVPLGGVGREALAVERGLGREANAARRGVLREEAALERGAADTLEDCLLLGGSFNPDTLVHTNRGAVPISEVRISDLVLAGDEVTGSREWKRVTDVFGQTHASSIRLVTAGANGTEAEIITTDEHPFWVEGRGWTPAGEIRSPVRIRVTHDWLDVTSTEEIAGEITTLNLTVAGFHTFYVGEQQAWVHNCVKKNPIGGEGYVGKIPKPPRGKGSVPPANRDPVRNFPNAQREAQRQAQGGKCGTGCGTDIDEANSHGHHRKRHADGGKTVPANHDEVCIDCHKELHSP